MGLLFKINHKDEGPQPWADRIAIDAAERMTGTGHDILRHPLFPVLMRARPLDGRSRDNYYTPRGDIQVRRVDGPWPTRWLEDVELVGKIHELGFDADPRYPRDAEAFDVFRRRLYRTLAALGIHDGPEAA